MTTEKTWKQWAADATIDFWSHDGGDEELTHECLEDAVDAYVYDCLTDGDTEAEIRSHWPDGLTVYGWRRRDVSTEWLRNEANRLAEVFAEDFEDEFGGGNHPAIDGVALANLEVSFREALKATAGLVPWQCEREAKTTIPLEELLIYLREHCPELFEVKP